MPSALPAQDAAPTSDAAPAAPERPGDRLTGGLLVVLALLSAIAPLATDLYLPAFPQMTSDLGATATAVQLSLTGFLLGSAVGQLAFGPLSDRFGRRGPLVLGSVLCVVASAVTVFAPTVEVLTVGRVAQGFAGAAGMVIGRAVISDLVEGTAAAKAFSLMMIIGGVAPVVAPVAGGLLADALGWRGILAVVLVLAVVMLVGVLAAVPETLPRSRRGSSGPRGGLRALRSRRYLGYTGAFAFGFTVLMAYISASPFVYQSMMGVSEAVYGLLFAVNAVAIAVGSAVSARLVPAVGAHRLLGTGLAGVLVGSLAVLVLALMPVSAWWLVAPFFLVALSVGLVLGNATGLALGAVTGAAGSASAVLGALQFGLAAVASPLVSLGGEDTALPLGLTMTAAALVAGACYLVASRSGTASSAVVTEGAAPTRASSRSSR